MTNISSNRIDPPVHDVDFFSYLMNKHTRDILKKSILL